MALHLQASRIPRYSDERVVDLHAALALCTPQLHRPGALDPARCPYDDLAALAWILQSTASPILPNSDRTSLVPVSPPSCPAIRLDRKPWQ
eukprot:1665038-Pyramimonas_sp.AAC.1